MKKDVHLTDAGNTYNGCLLLLREKGCKLSVECVEDNEIIYHAEMESVSFAADNPVSLLGLCELWNSLGTTWNCQKPDIIGELMS
ncbi:MAG: hypothetical protein KTR27_11845 [Leptolyngbyaceae cyanobacterium MAG.088]|nr:hypothetical protein [Leptolyngbyaceae cyanobacterium MAG.088]